MYDTGICLARHARIAEDGSATNAIQQASERLRKGVITGISWLRGVNLRIEIVGASSTWRSAQIAIR